MLTRFLVGLAVSLPLLAGLLASLVKAQSILRTGAPSLAKWRRIVTIFSVLGCACSASAFVLLILSGLLGVGFSKAVAIVFSRAFLDVSFVTLVLAAFATSRPRTILLIDNAILLVLWFVWLVAITVP
jgi:hypothetical protein